MPYDFDIKPGYVQLRLHGQVTAADLMGIVGRLQQVEAQAGPLPDRLVDFTAIEGTQVTFAEMDQVTAKRRAAKLKNRVKLAVVAGTPYQVGFARMFQTLNDNPQIETQIFPNEAAAVEWLRAKQEPA